MDTEEFTAKDAWEAAQSGRKDAAQSEIDAIRRRIQFASSCGLERITTCRDLYPETEKWLKENGYKVKHPFWDLWGLETRISWESTTADKT